MKKGYTEIGFIWDKSGSMCTMYNDALGGFNSFVKDQQADKDDTHITLVQFDNNINTVFDSMPVNEIKEFTEKDYRLGGSTALLDAIGATINRMTAYIDNMKEKDRPENVIIVIQTDGEENSSREFNNTQIQEMLKKCEDERKWQIIYLGANASAFDKRNNIGLDSKFMVNYANATTAHAYMASSMRVKDIKAGLNVDMLNGMDMTAYLNRAVAEDSK